MSKKIAIVGASGFMGRHLSQCILNDFDYQVTGLCRTKITYSEFKDRFQWIYCDAFSMLDLEKGLEGIDTAIYLLHSMLPSAHLNQGTFQDFDLILADNFVRAANKKGIRHIIFVSGYVPKEKELSHHLLSRYEVERTLTSAEADLTTLRTGLIVGESGSSYQIMINLVKRLPILVCPRWTQTHCQPIHWRDMVEAILVSIKMGKQSKGSFDLGGPDILTYKEMLKITAKSLGLKRYFIPVPYGPLKLSQLWVRFVSSSRSELVYPLIESLKHEMVASPSSSFPYSTPQTTFEQSILKSLEATRVTQSRQVRSEKKLPRFIHDVRSVQRLPLPPGKDAYWVAHTYMTWLSKVMNVFLVVKVEDQLVSFKLLGFINLLILELSESRSQNDRQLFYIKGGFLAGKHRRGRLEFREVLGKGHVIAAIHDFRPRLPWFLYQFTQAPIHLWVMNSFKNYLKEFIIGKGSK